MAVSRDAAHQWLVDTYLRLHRRDDVHNTDTQLLNRWALDIAAGRLSERTALSKIINLAPTDRFLADLNAYVVGGRGRPLDEQWWRPRIQAGRLNPITRDQLRRWTGIAPLPDTQIGDDPQLDSALSRLRATLDTYDLGELSDWAWQQILEGNSQERILLNMRQTDVWKDRYQMIVQRQANGLSPMSEAEVLAYETQVRQIMRAVGIFEGLYDEPSDFVRLGVNDVSVAEVARRVENVFQAVDQAPVEVQDYFGEQFGVQGSEALATFMLDPDRALPVIERQARAAQVGGAGRRFGFDVDITDALRLADLGVDLSRAMQGWGSLSEMRGLFRETIGERTDLTIGEHGIDTAFETGDNEAVRRRRQSRLADLSGGGGGLLGSSGLGIGTADDT